MMQNAEHPLTLPVVTAETLATVNAARAAWGLSPDFEKYATDSIAWPEDFHSLIQKSIAKINCIALCDHPGYRALATKAPAVGLAVVLFRGIIDAFELIAKVDTYGAAHRQITLLRRIIECTFETIEITKAQSPVMTNEQEAFVKRLDDGLNLTVHSLDQLLEHLK